MGGRHQINGVVTRTLKLAEVSGKPYCWRPSSWDIYELIFCLWTSSEALVLHSELPVLEMGTVPLVLLVFSLYWKEHVSLSCYRYRD